MSSVRFQNYDCKPLGQGNSKSCNFVNIIMKTIKKNDDVNKTDTIYNGSYILVTHGDRP